MVALLAFLGLAVSLLASHGPVLPVSIAPSLPVSPAQQACPPCLDQLPNGARWLATAVGGPDQGGVTETVIAYFLRDPSWGGTELGQVGAIAVRSSAGGAQVYPLGEELGENPWAEVAARDILRDGVTELAITGSVGAHSAVLHIYRWNGSAYGLLDEFFGDNGVVLRDVDGDGPEEVIVVARHYDRAQLRDETVMRWNGTAFKPDYSRWGFTFDDPGFKDYPEAAVLSYYLSIAAHNYGAAYAMLGPAMRSGQSQASFEQGFDSTRDLRVEDLEVTSEDAASAQVRVEISSLEALD
jgi:hypothetical protein